MRPPSVTWDCVVVGAGLSGLATACHLRDKRLLVLEAANRIAGRINTRTWHGFAYDLGAVVGYDPALSPIPLEPSALLREDGPLGLAIDGQLFTGDTPMDCAERALRCLAPRELPQLALVQHSPDDVNPGPVLQVILDALFHVIHPGDYGSAASIAKRDALRRFYPSHWKGGNVELPRQLASHFAGPIRLCAPVVEVRRDRNALLVVYCDRGRPAAAKARTVVIATSAVHAQMLLPPDVECVPFESPQYGRYMVVCLFGTGLATRAPTYVAIANEPVNMVFRRGGGHRTLQSVLGYFCDRSAAAWWRAPDQELIDAVIRSARHVGWKATSRVLHSDVKRWRVGATILGPHSHERALWRLDRLRPVFLTGDYMHPGYPYGMRAALASAAQTASDVRQYLEGAAIERQLHKDRCSVRVVP